MDFFETQCIWLFLVRTRASLVTAHVLKTVALCVVSESCRSKLTFSTNLFHHSLLAPPGLPSRTMLDRTYSAQRFFIFSYFFILGREVD